MRDVLNPILRQKGIKSMLGVPLIESGSVIGVLHVGTLEPRYFDPEDQELLQLVASRAAIAIEKAKVHDELVRLDQLKLNFVAIASHELRTPATSVYGIASTLRHHRDTLTPETREELEDALWEQAVRFRSLIEQLLDLSRLDAKAIPIERQAASPARAARGDRKRVRAGGGYSDQGPRGARGRGGPGGARAHLREPRPERRQVRGAARRRQRAVAGHVLPGERRGQR